MPRKLRIAAYPVNNNPYQKLFYACLDGFGTEFAGRAQLSSRWLQRSGIDILHIHWPESIWRTHARQSRREIVHLVRFLKFLLTARTQGIKVVWTAHNLEYHEGIDHLDRAGYRILAGFADLILCHSRSAAALLRRKLHPRAKVVVIPHGNYWGAYPPARPRDEVLTELGLRTDLPTVCCLGLLRDYKGIDVAYEGVARCRCKVQLIIGGAPHRLFDLHRLEREIRNLDGVLLIPRELSPQEFSDIGSACDAFLLPYRKITGSGVLLAAWSFGRGVIASDLQYFREAIPPDSRAGLLFKCGEPNAIAAAIGRYLQIPATERSQAAHRMAELHSWDRCVAPIAGILRAWGDGRARSGLNGAIRNGDLRR